MATTVKDAGEALSRKVWRSALTCGDMRDRFPCVSCCAQSPSACQTKLGQKQIDATRDYINGYGWDAAERLGDQP